MNTFATPLKTKQVPPSPQNILILHLAGPGRVKSAQPRGPGPVGTALTVWDHGCPCPSANSHLQSSGPPGYGAPRLPAPPSDVREDWAQAARRSHSPAPQGAGSGVQSRAVRCRSLWFGARAVAGPIQVARVALGPSGSAVQRAPWTTRVNWDATGLLGLKRSRAGIPPPRTPRLGSGRGHFPSSGCLAGCGSSSHN